MSTEQVVCENGMSITVIVADAGKYIAYPPAPQIQHANKTNENTGQKQVSARVTPDEHMLIQAKGGLRKILSTMHQTSKHTEEAIRDRTQKEETVVTESPKRNAVSLIGHQAQQIDHLVNKACLFKSPDDLVMLAVSEFLIRHNLASGT